LSEAAFSVWYVPRLYHKNQWDKLASQKLIAEVGGRQWEAIYFSSGNRVLRRIFGLKKDEVTRGWRKLHNEELHNLYSSPSIIRMIKSRRIRWAERVAQMGAKRNAYGIMVGKAEGKTTRKTKT
jgi:hypothetical protein